MNRGLLVVIPVMIVAFLVTAMALVRLQTAGAQQALVAEQLAKAEASGEAVARDLDKLRQQLGETQLAAAAAEAEAAERIAKLEAKLVAAERQVADAASGDDDWEDLSSAGDLVATDDGAKKKKGFGAIMENMFKDENMKKMMRTSQMAMIDRTYGKLFDDMGLSGEKLKNLKELLVERQMAGAERGMDFFTVGKDKEKMAALIDDLKLQREAVDAEIQALLNPDQFSTLKTYEETLGERMQVSQFAGAAQAVGEPLSTEQTESLISLMHDSNRQAFGDGYSQQDKTEAMRMMQSSEGIAGMIEKMGDANKLLIENSKEILTPGQQDAFAKHQQQQMQMQQMGMQMMQGMMEKEAEDPK